MNRRGFLRTCLGGVAAVVSAPFVVTQAVPRTIEEAFLRDVHKSVAHTLRHPGSTLRPVVASATKPSLRDGLVGSRVLNERPCVPEQRFPPREVSFRDAGIKAGYGECAWYLPVPGAKFCVRA